ncbi:glycoside hydrolase family 27 protein [Moniliophthora roreri]|nr:glycoside hydrolase family 27 protein [Moniliophthora roreri]
MLHPNDEKGTTSGSPRGYKSSPARDGIVLVITTRTIAMTFLTLSIAALISWFSLVSKAPPTKALDNGVGRLPFMGYNTWNAYHCDINETVIMQNAQLLVDLGLRDVGFTYMNIDDCYPEKERNAAGDIVVNATRFPSGMRNVTDRIHQLGFDSGWFTCQLYPGSYQNEARDLRLFREEWNFDLLKYDNCAVPFDEVIKEGMVGKFTRMADAIADLAKETGREPILFSLCQWGREQPWLWGRRLGQSWRSTDDVGQGWTAITSIINENSFITWASDFYGHNDMDILEVGNEGLNFEEAKTHFTAWAFLKSPLLILPTVTDEMLSVFKNTEIIAINQDNVVGTAVSPFRWGFNRDWTFDSVHPAQYWSGESENGTVFMLINVLDQPADMSFTLTESPWIRAGRQYSVRDLWTHTDNGTAVRNFTAHNVPAHGVVALLLKDAGDEPAGTQPPCARPEWCMDQNGTRIDQ